MAYQDSVNLTGLSEAYLDGEAKQSVMKYATAAARDADAALTAALREGMVCYLDDVNCLSVYTGSTWSTIGPVHGAWLSWTPVVVQGATPTLTNNHSTYRRTGRSIEFESVVSITGGGTAANDVTITLPVAAAYGSTFSIMGLGILYDASGPTEFAPGLLKWASSTTIKITAPGAGTYLGASSFTAALASGDIISLRGSYEAAADA